MTTQNTKQNIQTDPVLYDTLVEYIEANQNRFYLLAYSYAKDKDTALDIVQTSIYKALTSIRGLKAPGHMKTWFYRILVNTSIDELRRGSKILPMNPADLKEDSIIHRNSAHHSGQTLDHADRLDLYAALDNLDPKARTIINLRYFEDMKLEEIAHVLDENLSSVKARLYRTLGSLKIELNREDEQCMEK